MKSFKLIIIFSSMLYSSLTSYSQDSVKLNHTNQFTLLTGMIQPLLLRGVNLAGTYFTNRVSFEYSHGMFLNYPGFLRKDKNASLLYSQWSTGLGIGYRINSKIDIRAEAKAHRYLVNLVNEHQVEYTTYSVGLGLYSRRYLGKHFLLEYSLRYWPNISSTLPGNKYDYQDATGNALEHKAHQLGLIFNISVGYTFVNKP